MEIVIDIPGEPVAKGRPRFSNRGGYVKTYTPAKTKKYEEAVRGHAVRAMMQAGKRPMGCPVYVKAYIYLAIPKSWSKHKRELAMKGGLLPTGKPDKDNYEKALYDALNGVVWLDDCQITDSYTKKRYAALPMVRIKVIPLEAYAANQNPNKENVRWKSAKNNMECTATAS